MNTIWFLSIPAMMFPDREILVFEDTRLTYAQLQERVNHLANALHSLGLGRGSHIGIIQSNCSQYVEAYYATSKVGGTFVPINHRAQIGELKYMLNTRQVDALFVGDSYLDLAFSIRHDIPFVEHWIAMERRHKGMLYIDDILDGTCDVDREEDMDGDETNVLIYTSGTTALPKAVMLSYSNFFQYVFETVQPPDGTRWGATLVCAPLYHISGAIAMMSSIYGGRRLVLMRQFDAKEWLRLVKQEKITHAFLAPTMLKRLLEEPDLANSDLSSLETLSYGAAPMPLTVIRRAIETFPKNVGFINAFGQTETTATVTMLLPEDHRLDGSPAEIAKKLRRLSSIGRPLPDVEIRIVDENNLEVPRGEIGEIVVRTPRLMKGYIGQERMSQKILTGGWMHTRDLGSMDEDGYVFLAGRKDASMIHASGETGSTGVAIMSLYPGISIEGDQHPRGGDIDYGLALPDPILGRIHLGDVLKFLRTVYESLELERLRANYLSVIPALVSASAYGFHLVDTQTISLPLRASTGDDDCFAEPDVPFLPTLDSLPMCKVWTHQGVNEGILTDRDEWRCLPLREVIDTNRAAHFVRTPMFSADGRLLGALSFFRSGARPPFEYVDLGIIRLVANHMRVVLANALKYAEIRERHSVAEGTLQIIGSAVIVSDIAGNIKFANLQARKLMEQDNLGPMPGSRIYEALRSNLLEMQTSGKRIVTSAIGYPGCGHMGRDGLALRSVRIPSSERAVATFLRGLDEMSSFQHLSSLLSKREIEVLELVAQGLHNREIAESLVVTTNTVKHHLKQIFLKMQVTSRSELLAKAFSSLSSS